MTVGHSGGWWTLKAIADEARELAEASARVDALSCPICGNVLTVNGRGETSCDVGHYRGQAVTGTS